MKASLSLIFQLYQQHANHAISCHALLPSSSSFQSLKVQLGAFDNFGMDSWIGEEELEDKCLDCTSLLSSSLCLGEEEVEEVEEEVSHNIGDRVETDGIQVREPVIYVLADFVR